MDVTARTAGTEKSTTVMGRDQVKLAHTATPNARRWRLGVAVLGLLAVVGALVLLWPDPPTDIQNEPEQVRPVAEESHWPLTGVPVEVLPELPALLVKVSNSPEARPQTGLAEADVVFEELTEGGTTRYIAVLHSRLPEVIGPVRSARPVDVQVMSGFSRPGFAYSGARAEVRELLARAPAATITEGAPGFFRDGGRYASHPVAPHNLFLRVEDALEAVRARGAQPLIDIGWSFDEQPSDLGTDADDGDDGISVRIEMSAASTTTWEYDVTAGLYRRQQNGAPTEVTGTARIGAANVVVLDVRHYVGASGYPETDVLGSGPGLVLRDGQRHEVTWSKTGETTPLSLLARDGTPFALKPGSTWIHLPDELPPS